MTEINEQVETTQEEESQIATLEKLDIASLRKYAKLMNIQTARDWQRADFVEAIKTKQNAQKGMEVVFDSAGGPKPGFARIIVNRDPTPGHANSPVQVSVNGDLKHIPRGIEIDIPIPYVEALRNAKTRTSQQTEGPSNRNPGGVFRDEDTVSYPFSVVAVNPGGPKWRSSLDSRSNNYAQREAFEKAFGRWPTQGELQEAVKAKILRDL